MTIAQAADEVPRIPFVRCQDGPVRLISALHE